MPIKLSTSVPNFPTILLIGPAGSGKTTLMTRFRLPGKKIYIVDIDNNLAGPRKVAMAEKRNIDHVEYDHIHLDDNGVEVPMLQRATRLNTLLTAAVKDDSIGTIGITSTTSLNPVFMAEVLRQTGRQAGTAFELRDWGKFAYLYQQFIASLRSCGKVVIIDGHVQAQKGDIDQVLRYALAIPGATGDLLPMAVTDVWRTSVEQSLVGNATVDKYMVTTVQDERNPNIKSSLSVPRKFEATQANIDSLISQIV